MDALSTTQDDSPGADPRSVKSDDSSPRPESGRGSPPPNCAICLGTCRNKSFTDSCLHQFCFKCLLTWSKVKAECPLCKQNFRSIIHNVRSNHQYEEYMVEQRQTVENVDRIDIDALTVAATRRFRYRTTLTLPRRESIAIQQLLLHHGVVMSDVFPPASRPPQRRYSLASFRRTVYRHNLWARPLPDFTGRFRDCSPDFYRYNDTQMHRLVPWLNRELHYLLNENVGHISYVIARILELLPQYEINSTEFREAMQRYFGERTEHFLHELHCFASTPYDMTGYDRHVQYTTDTRISSVVNEISSSESDASADSDIVMISSSEPAEPPPGPSRVPAPVYPQNYIPEPTVNNVIPIETISQSDTDDDSSEVMVVGYIKPPQDRTPEVVDLLGSDSDVIVQDNLPPETPQEPATPESTPLVKVSLKTQARRRTRDGDSDSDDSTYRLPPTKRKRRHRSNDTATTTDTCRTTPSPFREIESSSITTGSIFASSSSPSPSTSSTSSLFTDSSSPDSSSDERSKPPKKRSKRKSTSQKNKRKTKKRTSRSHPKERKESQSAEKTKDKQSNRKSHSGKGVKSSKKRNESSSTSGKTPEPPHIALDQPSTSGSNRKSKSDRPKKRRRQSRESKRLKSVVNVINSQKNSCDSNSSGNSNLVNLVSTIVNPNASGPVSGDDVTRRIYENVMLCVRGAVSTTASTSTAPVDYSNSEDDLPLNLTIDKSSHSPSL